MMSKFLSHTFLKPTALILFSIVFSALAVQAQDAEITDEEIEKYVSVMAQIDTLKAEMKVNTSELVKGNELMDKGRVFNAIKKANGDSVAIAALEVSAEQLTAYEEINAQIEEMKAEFKTNYTALIKDDLGAGTYNKVKKALKSDDDVKSRYDEAVSQYQSASESEEPTEQG